VAAENLHALVGDAEPVVGAVTLSEPRAAGRRPGLVELGGGSQRHPAHRLGRDMHVRQFEGDALFLRDRLAVHDALFGVGQGVVEDSVGKAAEDCAERDARQVDDPLHVGAGAFPEPSAVGDEYILESDIRHLERAQAQGSLSRRDPHLRLRGRNDKGGAGALAFGGHGEMTASGRQRDQSFGSLEPPAPGDPLGSRRLTRALEPAGVAMGDRGEAGFVPGMEG
jgi:hypothetical protein